MLPLTEASAWPPTDPLRKYVLLPVLRSVPDPPASPARTPPEAFAMRADRRASPVASTDASCPSTSPEAARRAPRSSARRRVGFSLGPDDPRAAASERAGHADGDVGAAPRRCARPRSTFARAPALPSTPAGRRGLERHRERAVRAASHGHALVVAELDDGDRHGPRPRAAVESTSHGARSRSQSPPRDDAQRPQDLAGNRGRDVGARRARDGGGSTAQREGHEQHDGEVLDGSLATGAAHGGTLGPPLSRHNRAIAPRLRTNQRWRNQRPSPSSRKTTRSRPSIVTTSQ